MDISLGRMKAVKLLGGGGMHARLARAGAPRLACWKRLSFRVSHVRVESCQKLMGARRSTRVQSEVRMGEAGAGPMGIKIVPELSTLTTWRAPSIMPAKNLDGSIEYPAWVRQCADEFKEKKLLLTHENRAIHQWELFHNRLESSRFRAAAQAQCSSCRSFPGQIRLHHCPLLSAPAHTNAMTPTAPR
jgi:hypothetical protein